MTILHDKREEALNSYFVTAGCEYGRESFLDVRAYFGLESKFVMPDPVMGAHPFVVASYLSPSLDGDRTEKDTNSGDERGLGGDEARPPEDISHQLICGRRSTFIIDDSAQLEQAFFMASKYLCFFAVG